MNLLGAIDMISTGSPQSSLCDAVLDKQFFNQTALEMKRRSGPDARLTDEYIEIDDNAEQAQPIEQGVNTPEEFSRAVFNVRVARELVRSMSEGIFLGEDLDVSGIESISNEDASDSEGEGEKIEDTKGKGKERKEEEEEEEEEEKIPTKKPHEGRSVDKQEGGEVEETGAAKDEFDQVSDFNTNDSMAIGGAVSVSGEADESERKDTPPPGVESIFNSAAVNSDTANPEDVSEFGGNAFAGRVAKFLRIIAQSDQPWAFKDLEHSKSALNALKTHVARNQKVDIYRIVNGDKVDENPKETIKIIRKPTLLEADDAKEKVTPFINPKANAKAKPNHVKPKDRTLTLWEPRVAPEIEDIVRGRELVESAKHAVDGVTPDVKWWHTFVLSLLHSKNIKDINTGWKVFKHTEALLTRVAVPVFMRECSTMFVEGGAWCRVFILLNPDDLIAAKSEVPVKLLEIPVLDNIIHDQKQMHTFGIKIKSRSRKGDDAPLMIERVEYHFTDDAYSRITIKAKPKTKRKKAVK